MYAMQAIHPLLDREAPGIVHLLLSSSIIITPLAALSRPVAGTIRDTLVVTLPGSTKAVRENLTTLLDAGVVRHALDLIKGGSGKEVHSMLAKGGDPRSSEVSTFQGHAHHHLEYHERHHVHDHTHSHVHRHSHILKSDGTTFAGTLRIERLRIYL